MTVTRDTPWRTERDVPYATWRDTIASARNPNGTGERADPELASEAAWTMAQPLSALCLAMLAAESSYGTDFAANPRSNRNPLNLKLPQGNGYVSNLTWIGGIQSWRQRITSQTYKDGVYAKTTSIADLIHVFAPMSENDTEGYIAGVVQRMNGWPVNSAPPEGEEPMTGIVFGNVPHPIYQDRYIANSTAWNDLGKRGGKCVVWHRMYGTLWGTDSYFRGEASGRSLTDYGVGVAATDGASAGVILRWNDPFGRRAPWASGPVSNPIGDGAKFVNLYGINAVNRDGVSIEISGSGSTALDPKARAAIVALTAYYADQYGKVLAAKGKQFDYTTFPIIPSEDNRSFVCYHGEFYDGKRNSCPGPVVEAATNGMLSEVKAILQLYQTKVETPSTPEEPVYAKPQKPAAGDSIVNGRIFLAHAQEYTVLKTVTPRIYADPGSDPTGPDIVKGSKVKTSHVVSDVGESADLTAVLADGSRIPIKDVLVAA